MHRIQHCRPVQALCRLGRRADGVANVVLAVPGTLAALSLSVAAMHFYIALVLTGFLQPSYERFKNSTTIIQCLLYVVMIFSQACRSRVDATHAEFGATLNEDLMTTIEEMDATIADLKDTIQRRDRTIARMKKIDEDGDILALKDSIVAKEAEFAQKIGTSRYPRLNFPFNAENGTQIDPAIQAHRELVELKVKHAKKEMRLYMECHKMEMAEHEKTLKQERKKIRDEMADLRKDFNKCLGRRPKLD